MKTTGEDIFKALENADEHYIEECLWTADLPG